MKAFYLWLEQHIMHCLNFYFLIFDLLRLWLQSSYQQPSKLLNVSHPPPCIVNANCIAWTQIRESGPSVSLYCTCKSNETVIVIVQEQNTGKYSGYFLSYWKIKYVISAFFYYSVLLSH